jgi:rhodanese-related sulfurtransferase
MASISTPEEVKAAEKEQGTIFLDVRGVDEVKAESLQTRPFVHLKCSLDDCSELIDKAEAVISNKNGKTDVYNTQVYFHRAETPLTCCISLMSFCQLSAPVIVFCRSGRRAAKAKEVMEQMGYTKVLNAGGLKDLTYL